ncbi:MAG: sporulation integral membrane protein YtvI [Bacillota bacterium]
MQSNSAKLNRLIQVAIVAGIVVSLYLTYYYLFPAFQATIRFILPLLTPFIIAYLAAVLLEPIATFLQRRLKLSRSLAIFVTITAVLSIASFVAVLLIAKIIVELARLTSLIPMYSEIVVNTISRLNETASTYIVHIKLPPQILDALQGTVDSLMARVAQVAGNVVNYLVSVLTSLPSTFLVIVFAILSTFFLMRDRDMIKRGLHWTLPASWMDPLESLSRELGSALTGFVRVQIILVSITAMQTAVVLAMLQVEYAFTAALIVGIADMLPVLGPGSILLPWALWEFLVGKTVFAMWLLALFAFVTIVRQILQPKLVAESIGLHPLSTLIAMYIGLKSAGIIGLALGPIVLVAYKAVQKVRK